MKLLLDQGLPRGAVRNLAVSGIVAEHVGDLAMSHATDDEILDYARNQGAAVVTLDADFHQTLATSQATSPSVIRIRIEGLKADRLAIVISQVVATASAELNAGALVSVTPSRIRVRKLPIS